MLWNYKPVILGLCPNIKSLPISVDVCVIIFLKIFYQSDGETVSIFPLFPFCSVLVDLFTAASYTFSFRRPTRDKWSTVLLLMLNDLLLPFFFLFVVYIKKETQLCWGQRRKKPQHSRHPFLLLDGRRTRTIWRPSSSYWTPTSTSPAKESCIPFSAAFSFSFFSLFSILLINSDDDDLVFCFVLKLFHRVEIHFYAAPGGRTRQCQDSFLYRQQLHFTR